MAYLAPSAAIFSPSIARIAASTAKDWKFVDEWLVSKFRGRSPPQFERNPETLRALLVLASLNEATDEEQHLVVRAEAVGQRELGATRRHTPSPEMHPASQAELDEGEEELMNALQDSLSRDACSSLGAMAALSVQLGVARPTPEALGHELVGLRLEELEMAETQARVQLLHKFVEAEAFHMDMLLEALQNWLYKPAQDLARQNLDLQRRLKAMSARVPELGELSAGMETDYRSPPLTIDQVSAEESAHLVLLAKKMELETRFAEFAGIPADADAARAHLDQVRHHLDTLRRRRDIIFEGLIERETPRKRY